MLPVGPCFCIFWSMTQFTRLAGIALLAVLSVPVFAQNTGQSISLVSGGKAYGSYLSAGPGPGRRPGIVLVHSFNGLEQGYKDLVDKFAADGFVVLAVGWQTFEKSPSDAVVEQIKKQLNRLIDVIKVTELTGVPSLNRELMLVKVNAKGPQRGEIFQVADVFKAQIMDVGHESMTVELAGSPEKIDDLLALLQPYGIAEMARSGIVAMERSRKTVL